MREFVRRRRADLIVSDLAAAEVSSAISRLIREGKSTGSEARKRLLRFDAWRAVAATPSNLLGSDLVEADALVRRFELKLRTPDALHLTISRRLGATLVTFDQRLGDAADMLGWPSERLMM